MKDVTSVESDVDFKPIDTEEIVEKEILETRDAPPELTMPLLPYQRESLAWMCSQVKSDRPLGRGCWLTCMRVFSRSTATFVEAY